MYKYFQKFTVRFLKIIFLNISLHFLVKDGKPHLICELFSTVNNEGGFFFVCFRFLLALQADRRTDGRTDLRTGLHFFEIS